MRNIEIRAVIEKQVFDTCLTGMLVELPGIGSTVAVMTGGGTPLSVLAWTKKKVT